MYNHNRDKSHFEAKVVEIEKLPEKILEFVSQHRI
jgi:hypothetical protein